MSRSDSGPNRQERSRPTSIVIAAKGLVATRGEPRRRRPRTAGSNADIAGREVEHYFATYKHLEGVATEVEGWAPPHDATAEVEACVERYVQGITRRAKGGRG